MKFLGRALGAVAVTLVSGFGQAEERPYSYLVELCAGVATVELEAGNTESAIFPCLAGGVLVPFHARWSARVMGGIDFAPFVPTEDSVGGNAVRGNLMFGADYRLPIVAIPRVRFFLTPMVTVSFGQYSSLHTRRYGYTWSEYEDEQRFEAGVAVRTSLEYRPSRTFGGLVGGYCDVGITPSMSGCRASLGFRF